MSIIDCTTRAVFEGTAAKCEWTAETQVEVLLTYIEARNELAGFALHLLGIVEKENEYSSE